MVATKSTPQAERTQQKTTPVSTSAHGGELAGDSAGNTAGGTIQAKSGMDSPEWHRAASDFVAKSGREIEALRNKDGILPPEVSNWLSTVGKPGHTAPQSVPFGE